MIKQRFSYIISLVFILLFAACEQQELAPSDQGIEDNSSLENANIPNDFNYRTTQTIQFNVVMQYNGKAVQEEPFALYSDKGLNNLLLTASTNEDGRFLQKINLPSHIERLYLKRLLDDDAAMNGRANIESRIYDVPLSTDTYFEIELSKNLILTSICSDQPEQQRKWRVRNPNESSVEYNWDLVGSQQSGSLVAEPGDNFFFTNTESGPNTLSISWFNGEENKSTVKASGGAQCNSENLILTSLCSEAPGIRNWRVRNPNDESFTVRWEVVSTQQSGSLEVPKGDSFFTTQDVGGANTTKIFWTDLLGNEKSSTKASMNMLCELENLNLTSVCSDNPDQTRRWRVRNPNDFDVEVEYVVVGAGINGIITATPGDSFFETSTVEGANTTKIFWNNAEGNEVSRTKASGGQACTNTFYFPGQDMYGSLAYEDFWPKKGDYDFNDVVVDFNVKAVYEGANIHQLVLDFQLRTTGATFENGFGINLPIDPTYISSVDGVVRTENFIQDASAGYEDGHTVDGTTTIIVFDNASNLVEPFTHPATPYEIKITIDFKDGASLMLMEDYVANLNPFIFVNERDVEVHLPDLQPTSLANLGLLGTYDDASSLPTMTYKTANGLPWAVYTPVSFSYPLEDLEITKAYTQFKPWAESGGSVNPDWYLFPVSGQVK